MHVSVFPVVLQIVLLQLMPSLICHNHLGGLERTKENQEVDDSSHFEFKEDDCKMS